MLLTLGGAGLWWVRKLNKRQVIFEEVPASFNHASPEEQAA
jgi:hypothetical protein